MLYEEMYLALHILLATLLLQIRKSEDLQKLALSKHENADDSAKIFKDLNGALSLPKTA